MNLFKCHSENPSRQNSFEDLIIDRAMSDSEAGTSVFLITEVCDFVNQPSMLFSYATDQFTLNFLKFALPVEIKMFRNVIVQCLTF